MEQPTISWNASEETDVEQKKRSFFRDSKIFFFSLWSNFLISGFEGIRCKVEFLSYSLFFHRTWENKTCKSWIELETNKLCLKRTFFSLLIEDFWVSEFFWLFPNPKNFGRRQKNEDFFSLLREFFFSLRLRSTPTSPTTRFSIPAFSSRFSQRESFFVLIVSAPMKTRFDRRSLMLENLKPLPRHNLI